MSKKAKCGNCGKELDQEASPNWTLYCNEPKCQDTFMKEVLSRATKRKRGGDN